MRKNATKIAAMMLSLALTVTSVNIPTTASAASKVKLNKSKATLYVGGSSAKKTTTLKATVNGKKVSATFTSNKPAVAKVAKKTGKVTAVKAGTATITAKYKGKKATAKITVKQYVTGISFSQSTVELKEGEHINLRDMVTVSPANATNSEISFKSDDSLVAAVNAKGTLLKGVKEGKVTITATAKDGSNKKATVAVNVTANDVKPSESPAPSESTSPDLPTKEAKKVTMSVENPFSTEAAYANTLLVGSSAEVRVRVLDEDGNPVANQDVQLSKKVVDAGIKRTATEYYSDEFKNLTDTVKTTNSQGYVTFVFGLDRTKDDVGAIDATSTRYVSSFKLTASVVGNSDVKEVADVKFAALNVNMGTNINVQNQLVGTAYVNNKLELGTNAAAANQKVTTVDRNGQPVEYVGSQQVSAAGGTNHAVYFKTGADGLGLKMPGSEGAAVDPGNINETVNFDTGKYSTYATSSWAKVVDSVNAADLQYATVNFGKLSLSKYSRFVVQAYLVQDKNNPTAAGKYTSIPLTDPGAYVVGEKVSGDFSVQIPISGNVSGWLYVTAVIQSKGQVNTDVNEGFTVKNVLGVKNKTASTTSGTTSVAIEGLSVDWSLDNDATYDLETELKDATIKAALLAANPTGNKVMYRVPAFPRTGNGIITVYDSANKPVAYYAMPTKNDEQRNADGTIKTDASGNTLYKNVNVLTGSNYYVISQDEALNKVGTVTADTTNKNVAVVNSEKTGVTHVIGKISSSNPNIKIDATNEYIYTSVNWNPIPTAAPSTGAASRKLGAALVGQQITVKAQLVDQNNNPVTTSGVNVEFWVDAANTPAATNDDTKITAGTSTVGTASKIKVDATTNAFGQAELTLVAGRPAQATGIYAKINNNQYNLQYVLGNETVTENYIDLYWVDANIYFEPDANTAQKAETTYANPAVESKTQVDVTPTVGSHWAYEVRTNGDISTEAIGEALKGYLAGYNAVGIEGLTVQSSKSSDSVGDITDITSDSKGSRANATSVKAGEANLVNVLNNASVGNDVKFTFTGPNKVTTTVSNVGTGVATLDKKLTLNIKWTAGVPTAQIIIPTSLKAQINTTVPVYVLVQDANGNPLDKQDVTLTATGVGTVTNTRPKTDERGIAEFAVSGGTTAGTSSALTATVKGISGVFVSSIKWVNVSTLTPFEIDKVAYDLTNKEIKLTFTNEVYADSVIKELFDVTYDHTKQIVTEATVAGKTVTLKLPGLVQVDAVKDFEVTINPAGATKVDNTSITYKFVSVDGQFLDDTTGKNVITFDANGTIK